MVIGGFDIVIANPPYIKEYIQMDLETLDITKARWIYGMALHQN